jgi:hypothetical protein
LGRIGNIALAASCVLLATTSALAVESCGGDGAKEGGPFAPSAGEGITGSGIRLDPGELFSDRTAVLGNASDEVAV